MGQAEHAHTTGLIPTRAVEREGAPKPTRRIALAVAALPLCPFVPAGPAAAHADAALLATGSAILRLIAQRDACADEEVAEAIDAAVLSESRALAEMRASTLAGLVHKARMLDAAGDDDALGQSIVRDLLRIGGAA